MKKKIVLGFLACALLSTAAEAAGVEFTVGNPAFKVEEAGAATEKILEAAPYISEAGRTMVPVRAISEAFGAAVDWNGDARTVSVRTEKTEILLTVDSPQALINGTSHMLDAAPVILEGRTFVPLRFIGEALSCNVNYAAITGQILIDDTEAVLKSGDKTLSLAQFKAAYDYFYGAYKAQGAEMTENEYAQIIAEITMQSVYQNFSVRTAFPDLALSEADKTALLEEWAEIEKGTEMPLKGYLAQLLEDTYFRGGLPIIARIMEAQGLEPLYTEGYVCAKHILVEDEETANAVYEKAVAGTDFDSLIAEYNTDPGMEQNPGGYVFTTGEMVKEFEAATFGAKIDEITKPVQTTYGYHIIKRLPLPALSEETKTQIAARIAQGILDAAPAPEQLLETDAVLVKLRGK